MPGENVDGTLIAGKTLARIGGALLIVGLLISFIVVASLLSSLAIYVLLYPLVFIGALLNLISAIMLLATDNGVIMIVAGTLGATFSILSIGGIVGLIGGISGLIGGILVLVAQPAPAPAPAFTPPIPPPTQPQAAVCPTCGGPLVYVQQYQRWYCNKCQRYV
ncbi:MAG: hypothetical protein QXJ11_03200 [Candidatus Bathyarchaeia archaeon]